MGQEPVYELPEFGELKAALEEEWPQRQLALRKSGVFLNDEDDDNDDDDTETGGGDDDDKDDGETKTYDESYVKKLREENARRRRENQELSGRLKAHEDANKTELEREQEARTSAEQRATAAESASLRLEVALDKAPEGMGIAQVRKLAKRLTGSTKEELEADAEELFADFVPNGDDGDQGSQRRPKERLRSGAAPSASDDDEETDPAKLAAKVRPMY